MTVKLKLQDERNYFKPFHYPWAYDAWLKHEQSHWLHTEVPMLEDVKDWKTNLSTEEKYFLTNIFRFFTQSDIDVGMPDTTYNEFLEYEAMQNKHEYFHDKLSGDASVPLKIAAISAFTEGLALFSSFIMLLNFPRHGKMKGMGQIVTWSIVDETQHAEGMIQLFRAYVEENRDIWNDKTKGEIYSTATDMVDLEDKFVDLAFKMGKVEGLRDYEVKEYIRYIADRRLISMGLKGIYKVKTNPLPWVETMINAPTHTNFFENRATDYAKGALQGNWSDVWKKSA
jgi:ribonucleoside-diphosphate reductase beta chain